MKKCLAVVLAGCLVMAAGCGKSSKQSAEAQARTDKLAVSAGQEASASGSLTRTGTAPTRKEAFALSLPPAESVASVGSLPPSQPKQSTFDPQKLAADTEALIKKIPEARYDLEARTKELGAGIDPIFALVRDEIRFESYAGVLRGASGTYLARAGNAADRSLLLALLLKLKGVPVRFAIGRLSTENVECLFAHIFDPPRVAPAPAVPRDEASDAETAGLRERLYARARRDYGVVRSALGRNLPPITSPSRDNLLAELERHVWVQAQVDGSWIDLDTAFPDAVAGKAYTSADETMDALPEKLCQWVTLRVIGEKVADKSLSRETALEVSFYTVDLLDAQIVLGHAQAPKRGAGVWGALGGDEGSGSDDWMPVLWIDGDIYTGEPISFGTGGESTFVAEWLEFELTFPDGSNEVNRRTLVDRAGAAWRMSGTLTTDRLRPLQRNEAGIKAVQAAYNIWFSAGGHNALQYAKALNALAASFKPVEPDAAQEKLPFEVQAWVFSVQNFAWILMTDKVIIPALNEMPGLRFYHDSPRISVFGVGLSPWEEEEETFLETDLRRDHLRGIARKSGDEAAVAERKLWFGVIEGALEHEMLAEQAAVIGFDPARVETTSALLGDDGVVVLSNGRPEKPQDVSPEAAVRIDSALERGAILVAPRGALKKGEGAWWEIAPFTGDVRSVCGPDLNKGKIKGTSVHKRSRPDKSSRVRKASSGKVYEAIPEHFKDLKPLNPNGTAEAEKGIVKGAKGSGKLPKNTGSQTRRTSREPEEKGGGGITEYLNVLMDIAIYTLIAVGIFSAVLFAIWIWEFWL
jgi:transglutaminase-like putative cysteine protease